MMKEWLIKLSPWSSCCASTQVEYEPLDQSMAMKTKRFFTSVKALLLLSAALLVVVYLSTRLVGGGAFDILASWTQQAFYPNSYHPQLHHYPHYSNANSKPITLNCSSSPTINKTVSVSSPAAAPTSSVSSNTCPDYFRWIYEDLKPWKNTGISREMVESSKPEAAFRLIVLEGKVYVDRYHPVFQTRDIFTFWGILQLAYRYPGRIPDLDLMFNCEDMPVVKAANYQGVAPPPLFRYCKSDETVDIIFPDWSFWGWPEINIKPWAPFMDDMEKGNEKMKWEDRKPYAFWKGNRWTGEQRKDLMNCDISHGHEWNARIFDQNWDAERDQGYKHSNMADQCDYRYKIFAEGRSWSVSKKYIMACNSPSLFITTHYDEFFSRSLMPGFHYWPIKEDDKCKFIKYAVDWGNKHPKQAQEMGKAGSKFVEEEVSMDYVYDYMLHLLTEYSKLLTYKPTLTENAKEYTLESLACPAESKVKEYMLDSMEKWTREGEPCTMQPPFKPEELQKFKADKANAVKAVERLQQIG